MYPIYLTQGETLAYTSTFSAAAGAISIFDAGLPSYVAGRPLFYHDDATDTTVCLGRVSGSDTGRVDFAWSIPAEISGAGRLFQPALTVAIPAHLRPLLHTEYQMGLVERETAGGSSIMIEQQRVSELLRLRLPSPPNDVLQGLLEFARSLRVQGTLLCTLVDKSRAVRRVALADETIELHAEQFHAGDPFDLMLRVDADGQHA